ncbi:MAG: amidase family protein [Actinomycetota bacterium]|nr:amidase family protein [Actinomycetota bacterium]
MSTPCEMSARELVTAMTERTLSAREALAAHLSRIEQVNPHVNAVVTLDPEGARAAAAAADERAAAGGPLPLLHGLPMTHKDTHMVAGMRSTNGSPVFADHVPLEDDLVVARLRAAGVVATGKTNVPEFGAGSHTFNEVFGTTTNPWAPGLSAGGSSGGVAAAVATGIQAVGDGSDMGGSLRIPASFCNVVGLRPSYAVVPDPSPDDRRPWLGRTGAIGRTVDDVALFMAAVAGPDPRVGAAPLGADAFAALTPDGPVGDLRGLRVGWSPDLGLGVPVEPEVLAVCAGLLRVLQEAGAHVDESAPDLRDADRVFEVERAMTFAAGLGDVVRSHRERVKPEVVWNVELGWSLTAADVTDAREARTRLDAAVARWLTSYDVLLTPAAQVLPFDASLRYPAEVAGVPSRTYLDWMRSACVLSATGLPVLALPAGFTDAGLPVGVQLAAAAYRDVDLLRWGRVVEERTGLATRRPLGL